MVPTPGPYSTMVRARFQSTLLSRRSMRKRELGISDPSILGCCRKFLANSNVSSLREVFRSINCQFLMWVWPGALTILVPSLRCKEDQRRRPEGEQFGLLWFEQPGPAAAGAKIEKIHALPRP